MNSKHILLVDCNLLTIVYDYVMHLNGCNSCRTMTVSAPRVERNDIFPTASALLLKGLNWLWNNPVTVAVCAVTVCIAMLYCYVGL